MYKCMGGQVRFFITVGPSRTSLSGQWCCAPCTAELSPLPRSPTKTLCPHSVLVHKLVLKIEMYHKIKVHHPPVHSNKNVSSFHWFYVIPVYVQWYNKIVSSWKNVLNIQALIRPRLLFDSLTQTPLPSGWKKPLK